MSTQESMNFDIVIVGGGPSGLSAAIQLAKIGKTLNRTLSICVLEKGDYVGAHTLSGAVLDPRALNELFPDWKTQGAPVITPVNEEAFYLLTASKSWSLPIAPSVSNHGNYIISLGRLCQWLAIQAEALGVQIFPGFAGKKILYDTQGKVCGIRTSDLGVDKNGQPTARYQSGINLYAKQTLFAEGCRGSLTKQLIKQFNLYENATPQTYGIGIKELWEVPELQHKPGFVLHTLGWPLDSQTYGGSFMYHLEDQKVSLGFVVGLDYTNPYLDPYEELQRFKTHPKISPFLKNAKRIAYGARALNEGGFQSIPRLSFPGGLLIGDCAGFLDVLKIKGIHNSMKSGMLAADIIHAKWDTGLENTLSDYDDKIKQSWIGKELKQSRNIRPGFKHGLWPGLINAGLESYFLKGKAPWTLKQGKQDYQCLKKASQVKVIQYPKHDGFLTFDKLDSVYLSNTQHSENQPGHLELADPSLAITVNFKDYDSPETRYCPACVYEIVEKEGQPTLQINSGNCIHCKTCDIKDPCQNINWVPPEGGGPAYSAM